MIHIAISLPFFLQKKAVLTLVKMKMAVRFEIVPKRLQKPFGLSCIMIDCVFTKIIQDGGYPTHFAIRSNRSKFRNETFSAEKENLIPVLLSETKVMPGVDNSDGIIDFRGEIH